jgi:signal transduction histidine kinase
MELAEKARLLSEQNIEVERKNREVEQAKLALEDKATQLALSSKYKSEFLANMSHELRTPLNSLLILAQQLSRQPGGQPVDQARWSSPSTIHGSGSDLLTLINDILDLSKIESGTVTLDDFRISASRSWRNYVDRTFRHMAEAKHLGFEVDLDADNLPTARDDRHHAPAAGPEKPAVERVQVHQPRPGVADTSAWWIQRAGPPTTRMLLHRRRGAGVRRYRHRRRHPGPTSCS